MYQLNLANHITRLRHERQITQEELADFLGVTKASVSKWENAQSTPDLMLLLGLASFFDVTVDQLLGYEPRLSREQIRRHYAELSGEFASRPFHEVMDKIRSLAHRYYSCYPFLLQLVSLCCNHYMLAETKEEGRQILEEAVTWCGRILENCREVDVCGDALTVKAGILLQLGRAAETIELLESSSESFHLSGQNGAILVQAYQMTGKDEKARSCIQTKQYVDLVNLVGDAMLSLSLYVKDLRRCEETICRIRGVMEHYRLENLHPNLAAQFHYQSAVVYAVNEKHEEALAALGFFEKCVDQLLNAERIILHGDEYFDHLDEWIESLPLGDMAPRDRNFIRQNVRESLSHPAFEAIKKDKKFQRLVHRFTD